MASTSESPAQGERMYEIHNGDCDARCIRTKAKLLNSRCHNCKGLAIHENTLQEEFLEVMSSLLRYANDIRKQRQRAADYIVALESALDDANITMDDAVTALNEFASRVTDEFDAKLCEVRKKRKEILRDIKNDSWSLCASMAKQKEEIDGLAEQYIDVVDFIENMRRNFHDIKELTDSERLASLELQVKSHSATIAPLSDAILKQPSNANQTIPMILSEISLMIHRLKGAQKVLEIVQLDEHPKSSEIESLIEKAHKIEKLLQMSGDFAQMTFFEDDLRSE